MELQQAVEKLKKLERTMHAHNHAMGILYYDALTTAPSGSSEARGVTLGVLSEEDYKLFVNDEVKELLAYLDEHKAELDEQTAREAHVLKEDFERMTRIPMDEYVAYEVLVNEAQDVWHKAKLDNDFAAFQPYLERLVERNRKFAGYYDPDKKPYDALLDQYEKGATMETLDAFFGRLKAALVPLIAKIRDLPMRDDFLSRTYPADVQRKLSDELMRIMCVDRTHCGIGETEHPFTTDFSKYDVRITTHYYENALASSMYSVIHESGHALYELHTGDALQYGCLANGCSTGIHESQSRFYENLIGRSEAFVNVLFPKLRELFPEQLADVTADDFYRAVNRAQPSLIRTEADELTYCMHIIIRYELEKRLIGGTLSVAELPAQWNALYKEYLGVDVPSDREGVLQDSHWSSGSFGYFPSYALGSAYGAQIMARMRQDVDVDAVVRTGSLQPINDWLEEHLHRFGKMYDPSEMLERTVGAPFDPQYYIDYLTQKYTALYHL